MMEPQTGSAPASSVSLTSSVSIASSSPSPRTPDSYVETYGAPCEKSVIERINNIADFITVQERCAAELHDRLAQLTRRVHDLAAKLQDVNSTTHTTIWPKWSEDTRVQYPPERGLPTTKGRCQILAQKLGMAQLDIPAYTPPRPSRGRVYAPQA